MSDWPIRQPTLLHLAAVAADEGLDREAAEKVARMVAAWHWDDQISWDAALAVVREVKLEAREILGR